jgi:hypothetical protein
MEAIFAEALTEARENSSWTVISLGMLSGMAILLLDGRVEHIGRPNHILMWLFFLTILFGLMLLPGILGIVRRATQSLRPA